MAQPSTNTNSQDTSNLPAHLNSHYGFGNGFRFHYDPHTGQSDWAKNKYQSSETISTPALVMPKPANDETSLAPYDRLAFATEVSIRYHHRRHAHYDNAFRVMMMAIILLSAFAFMSGVHNRTILGLTIIGIAAGTMIWNITSLSRLHDVLRSEYQNLLEHMRMTETPTHNEMRSWRNLRLRIRAKEPPVFWAVANDCYYEVARAWDLEPQSRSKLPVMLRPFKNWVRF